MMIHLFSVHNIVELHNDNYTFGLFSEPEVVSFVLFHLCNHIIITLIAVQFSADN